MEWDQADFVKLSHSTRIILAFFETPFGFNGSASVSTGIFGTKDNGDAMRPPTRGSKWKWSFFSPQT